MSKMPKIGELRHKITVQTDTKTVDTDGVLQDHTWTAVGPTTQRAKIKPMNVSSPFVAGRRRPEAMYEVWIRDDSPSTAYAAKMRISATMHGTARLFKVVGLQRLPDEKPRWIMFICEEVPAQ